MVKAYKVAIIGAGRIAAGFDSPDSEHILTHARAFTKHPHTELIGFFDTDSAKAQKEAARWNTKSFGSQDELFAATPDIVVIASPDDTHSSILSACAEASAGRQKAAMMGPKLIICEKPVVATSEETALIESIEVPVIVNFRRRFDPVLVKLRESIQSGEFGRVISANFLYSKGLLHNGSHMIDLAHFLFGDVLSVKKISSIQDWEGDASVSAFLTFEKCPQLFLTTGDERAYSICEYDILLEKRRFRFTDEGFTLTTEEVIPDPIFVGYKILGNSKSEKTGLIRSMELLAEHAVAVASGKETSRSSLSDALRTHQTCFRLAAAE